MIRQKWLRSHSWPVGFPFVPLSATMRCMDWQRLADEVVRRRGYLGLTRREFAEDTGFAAKTLGDIENARRKNYGAATLARLERALRWPSGAVDAILRGEPAPTGVAAYPQPTEVTEGATVLAPTLVRLMRLLDPGSGLPDADRATLADLLDGMARVYEERARRERRAAG